MTDHRPHISPGLLLFEISSTGLNSLLLLLTLDLTGSGLMEVEHLLAMIDSDRYLVYAIFITNHQAKNHPPQAGFRDLSKD